MYTAAVFRGAFEAIHAPVRGLRSRTHERIIELIRDSFVEIPRRPLPTREGAAFVAIKARELHCDRLDALLQPKRLAIFI